MRVRMLTSMAGPRFSRDFGQLVEMEKDEAKRLIERGFAEPVQEKRETATRRPRETR